MWIIKDWAGNICFNGIEFDSFDDGEHWLTCKFEELGLDYDEERGEYEIELINKGE